MQKPDAEMQKPDANKDVFMQNPNVTLIYQSPAKNDLSPCATQLEIPIEMVLSQQNDPKNVCLKQQKPVSILDMINNS